MILLLAISGVGWFLSLAAVMSTAGSREHRRMRWGGAAGMIGFGLLFVLALGTIPYPDAGPP